MCQCFQRSKRLYWTHGCSRCGMALTNPLSTDIAGLFFQNRFGDCISPHCINRAIERISRDYNAMESAAAEEEGREPVLLPHFTVHNLRHTFCTRFCENETNLKVIQEIMGHADISTTMRMCTAKPPKKRRRKASSTWRAKSRLVKGFLSTEFTHFCIHFHGYKEGR